MKATDFEYDGLALSDFGYIICSFSEEGLQTITGSQITFNTVSTQSGAKFELTSVEYGEALQTTFQICKNTCNGDKELEIPLKEYRDLMSWLGRKQFHKFKLLKDEYLDIYFEASFNVSRIEIDGKLYGLELTMTTNRPFALGEPRSIIIDNADSTVKTIMSESDEEGYIYPKMEITIKNDGNLSIYNEAEDRTMYIANCSANEVINIDYPIIRSSIASHKIQNDFNWNFFRLASTFQNKKNKITITLPCTIKMTYSPIIKIVL